MPSLSSVSDVNISDNEHALLICLVFCHLNTMYMHVVAVLSWIMFTEVGRLA